MNNHAHNPADDALIKQVDARLNQGKRAEMPVINALADSTPQAGAAFENELEKRLVAQLHRQSAQSKESNAMQATLRPTRTPSISIWLSAAAVLAITIAVGVILSGRGYSIGMLSPTSQVAVEPIPQHVVVATQNIRPGVTITAEMVALVSLPMEDFTALQDNQPERQFFHDLADVVGQTTTTAIFWFEPIEPIKLGQVALCAPGSRYCADIPEGMTQIDVSLPLISVEEQGLVIGDRVDVLAAVDNQMTVIVRDVLLANIQPDRLTFATPSWKQTVLITLRQTHQPYVLRRASDILAETLTDEEARVDYTFTSPEALPDGYLFDLIAEFPAAESYQLSDAPNLDTVQFTQRDTIMNFWFTDLDVVSITDGTQVVIRLPEADAIALSYLIEKGAELTFIPQ